MKRLFFYIVLTLLLVSTVAGHVNAQQMPGVLRRLPTGGGGRGGGGGDSLKRRDKYEDSITISYRLLDSTRTFKFDSTLNDFTRRFPIPATDIYLGNTGNAGKSILFSPRTTTGWDPGFHAFDIYKWNLDQIRFFNTTRPYTELGYLLGGQSQQIIEILHTQNIKPYWSASLQYRLINSPGLFKSQKTNHNNYLLTSWYQGPKKRYNNYLILLGNSLQSEENGGILNDKDYLNSPSYEDRFNIPTKIGGDASYQRDFFNNTLNTGNRYSEFTTLLRQQYDLGQKDSIVTDSTVIPLFYPRLRFEHTFRYQKMRYRFIDNVADSDSDGFYSTYYGLKLQSDSFLLQERWSEVSNDFSIYQFPDAKNLHQFLKLGIEYQLLQGQLKTDTKSLHNFIGHGEYRNRTRNKKWDFEAFGSLHLNGYNAGDYHALASITRIINPAVGSLQLGFENVNRSPSFNYDTRSNFYLDESKSFSKENTLHFFASTWVPKIKLQLRGDYFLVSNYLYLTNYYKMQQENALFNLLRISASTTFKIGRRWNWYSDVYLQQKTGAVNLNVPLVYTRNRFVFEGNFFKNLFLATGLEVRYHTPYKADDYSPVLGQFFYQDSVTISNFPDIAAFLHFRIRSFKAFIRAENLNTFRYQNSKITFTNNNLAAPDYAYPGLTLRFGFYWSFVN
ncbi:putative porin [Chitinophagaceae bacterium LB-8]|uniref:Porin n=1 Tax=Paraflavisolibacter caeni TaxID=2982496 RepID=A0A9X2Y0V5_9BACT|nr:putative porin [Paraflavisolibacter caeni]MCU7551073.1 putative porin [Paraflavisolibacter caeni]